MIHCEILGDLTESVLGHTEGNIKYYFKRHHKRLQDTDYKLKWERIKEIEL